MTTGTRFGEEVRVDKVQNYVYEASDHKNSRYTIQSRRSGDTNINDLPSIRVYVQPLHDSLSPYMTQSDLKFGDRLRISPACTLGGGCRTMQSLSWTPEVKCHATLS